MPLPATRGALPRFSHMPPAPPVVVPVNKHLLMPVAPTLLGPPEAKLPEMAENQPWGDPHGVLGPLSGGLGKLGGIVAGKHGGVGDDNGQSYGIGGEAPYHVGGSK
jgi:hypothetical protein